MHRDVFWEQYVHKVTNVGQTAVGGGFEEAGGVGRGPVRVSTVDKTSRSPAPSSEDVGGEKEGSRGSGEDAVASDCAVFGHKSSLLMNDLPFLCAGR